MILLAQIISSIFNPIVLTPLVAYALILVTTSDFYYSFVWATISLVFALIIAAFVLIGMRMGIFSNFDVSVRTQRKPVFAFAGLILILYFLLIIVLRGPVILLLGLGVLLIGIIIADLINTKVKASMHMAVTCAFSFIYALFFGGYFWFLPLFLPSIVAWSRLKLKRHTPLEVLVGSAFGLSLVIVLLAIIRF